jgi:general stress protein 26
MNSDNLSSARTRAIRATKKIDKNRLKADKEARAQALHEGLKLVDKATICFLGTNGEDGFPRVKAMLNLKHEGLKKVWFSTNTSSKHVHQLKKDDRACVYYVNETNFQGLMLIGTMEILQDTASKKMLWSEGSEVYYPLGVEDPDYTVLGFTAQRGNYYHGLKNIDFEIV